uniref:Uncharacterized protein n=1 Tax=Avena sativa TaxID=4498 RepID=A0ACD5YIC3_AVESA
MGSQLFDSAVLHGGDVLVFAKGVIRRQVANQADLQCVYRDRAGAVVASFPAIASAQQVARCSPPPMHLSSGSTELRVTLAITGEEPVPSLATYRPQQSGILVTPRRNMLCACTMVRNISKFVREWVLYHAALGVDQFFLYDNGSEDNLADQVAQLRSAGIDVSTVAWPWIKTQEAGLSHCAAAHQTSCQWMAFIDVDEFIFSPRWKSLEKPSKSMLQAILSVDPWIGQIYNSVHHFTLKSAFNVTWTKLARVNHYKYQAWTEFKVKFKRRVSAYVADWADPVDLQSKDRAPGLGVDAIEPPGWAEKFCQVKDTVMQELSAKWFGIGFARQASTTDFKSEGPHGTRTVGLCVCEAQCWLWRYDFSDFWCSLGFSSWFIFLLIAR